jgi:hypothetical protein
MTIAGPALADPAADPDPAAGCGKGLELGTIGKVVEEIDERIYTKDQMDGADEVIGAADSNGDGYLCWKHYKPNTGQDKHWIPDDLSGEVSDYVITLFIDNNAKGQLKTLSD